MKLAELQEGKWYLVYGRENWGIISSSESYFKTSKALARYRFTPVFRDGSLFRRGNQILMKRNDLMEWTTLKQIRSEFIDAVVLITNNNRNRKTIWNDRGVRYAEHLKRKAERARKEREKPIKDSFFKAMQSLNPDSFIYEETKLNNLPIAMMEEITEAIINHQALKQDERVSA